ncbi:MAG: universal stress protein [Candidatus Hydrothermarchaeaceae archaeon]
MVLKILVPTDGSEPSDNAVEYAVKLAKLYEGELLILNVVSTSIPTAYHGVSIKEELIEEMEEEGKRIVGRSVNNAKSQDVNAEGLVRHGLPDKEIIALAKERDDIELVVMGAYGKNFIERQLVGSKTERVLRGITELDVPLVIIPCPCKK